MSRTINNIRYYLELPHGGQSPLYFLSHCCGQDWPPLNWSTNQGCAQHHVPANLPDPPPKPSARPSSLALPSPNVDIQFYRDDTGEQDNVKSIVCWLHATSLIPKGTQLQLDWQSFAPNLEVSFVYVSQNLLTSSICPLAGISVNFSCKLPVWRKDVSWSVDWCTTTAVVPSIAIP